MKWSKGDKVMAKWPGSSLYFHAEVKEIDEIEETAEVIFEDGTAMEVELKFLSSEEVFRPKRSKSPARSRRRSRSPGRSPGRKSKAKTTVDGIEKKSPSRGRKKKLPSTESSSSSQEDKRLTVVVKRSDTGSAIRQVTEQITEKKTDSAGTVTVTKSKTLFTESPVPDSRYMVTRQRIKNQVSEEEHITFTTSSGSKSKKEYEKEFGGVLGTFLIYATIPILPCLVLLGCTAKDCSVTKFNISMIPRTLKGYYDLESVLIFFGFLLFHAIIYILPFGYILEGPPTMHGKRLPYRISAMYTLILTFIAYGLMFHYKIPVTIVHAKMFKIAVTGTVFSYAATIFCYLKSFGVPAEEINPRANTGSPIYDSFLGREMHPRFGTVFDLKLYLYRPSMGGWLVVVMIELQRAYEKNGGEIPTMLLFVGVSQMIYIIMEFFWDESQCPFMFDIKNEGLGFVQFFGELVLVPFVYSLVVKYVAEHPQKLSNLSMALTGVCYVAGMLFIVLSGIQKSRFRQNPYDPSLSNMESLPASKPDGHRLLVSGLWGVVRHPNYLGEILVGLGWSFACGFEHLLPWYYPVFVTVLLCHRALRCDGQCDEKHGHAWTVYCQRVKYRVIPYVF